MSELLRHVGLFAWAVFSHWQAWVTGGGIAALTQVVERLGGWTLSRPTYVRIFIVSFLLVAFFLAWRDQYTALIEERRYRSRVADELAELRHAAQKRYYAWWESCFDQNGPKPADPVAAAEAEKFRVQIFEKLEKEISLAAADYFNTPKMNEPFPPNRNLVLCPDAVHIKEFGYRVERLSEIIQRILPKYRLS